MQQHVVCEKYRVILFEIKFNTCSLGKISLRISRDLRKLSPRIDGHVVLDQD